MSHSLIMCLLPAILHSLIHSFNQSFNHTFTHSFTHAPTHSVTHSFTHLLTHSLSHLFTRSFTRVVDRSRTFVATSPGLSFYHCRLLGISLLGLRHPSSCLGWFHQPVVAILIDIQFRPYVYCNVRQMNLFFLLSFCC